MNYEVLFFNNFRNIRNLWCHLRATCTLEMALVSPLSAFIQ